MAAESSCAVRQIDHTRVIDELSSRIVALAGRLSAATCAWLLLVADFDAREGFVHHGLASTAQWLSHACGIAHRTAIDHVRVARCLMEHERLAKEMGAGRLSYSQLRAISRVVRAGEHELVDDLVEAAQYGTVAQLELLVRGMRTVDDNEVGAQRCDREYVKHAWTSQSMWRLTARLDPERGAMVTSALEAFARAHEMSVADALVRLAEFGLATLADGAEPPRSLRGDERAAVVVHLDASRLPTRLRDDATRSAERDQPDAGPTSTQPASTRFVSARLANGGPGLPDHVVEWLLCAGRVRTVLHDAASNVLDVGRSHRLVTDRQYRALLIRHHGHCAYPGCANTRGLQAHHRLHWLHGGRTDLENLLLLCERHHVMHHDGVFTIESGSDGRFRFFRPDGRELGWAAQEGFDGEAAVDLATEFAAIAPDAATPRLNGQRLDLHYAVTTLAERRYRVAG